MNRVRILGTIAALLSLSALAVAWPAAGSGYWQWLILAPMLGVWLVALWTRLQFMANLALFAGFLVSAVLISRGASGLVTIAGACLTLVAWMHSRILQIVPSQAVTAHEMRLVRSLLWVALLIIGVSLSLAAIALNIALPMPFVLTFVGAAALILLISRLIGWLRQLPQ